jgi:hypothetical protein
VLLKLAEVYDVDLRAFAAEGPDGTGVEQLGEIFADPMFATSASPRYELLEVADNAPPWRTPFRGSTRPCSSARQHPRRGSGRDALVTPETWVRDHIRRSATTSPYIEEAAETLAGSARRPARSAADLRSG